MNKPQKNIAVIVILAGAILGLASFLFWNNPPTPTPTPNIETQHTPPPMPPPPNPYDPAKDPWKNSSGKG